MKAHWLIRLRSLVAAWVLSLAHAMADNSPPSDNFDLQVNGLVMAAAISDQSILIGGWFTNVNQEPPHHLARIFGDGQLDPGFNPVANDHVYCILVQPDGKIVVGGRFTTMGGQPRARIARLHPDGNLDASFRVDADNSVFSLASEPGGALIVGGEFSTVGGYPRYRIVRLTPEGAVDPNFRPAANGSVNSIAVQSDGRIVVGGNFTKIDGVPRLRLARVDSDGDLDESFNPGADATVYVIAEQADHRLIVTGDFSSLGGVQRPWIGRLNTEGTIDEGFTPEANGWIYSVGIQEDGRIIVGGTFTTLEGEPRKRIGRLERDGSLDHGFNIEPAGEDYDFFVPALLLQDDGKLLVSRGRFAMGGNSVHSLLRFRPAGLAEENLTFDGSTIMWRRLGTLPQLSKVDFAFSANGTNWTRLSDGEPDTSDPGEITWRLNNVVLPNDGVLRARGRIRGGYFNGSESVVESYLGRLLYTLQPQDRTNDAGTTAVFSIRVAGSRPMSVQWYKDGEALADGLTVAGSARTDLVISGVLGKDKGDYNVVVSNGFGSVTSRLARLVVNDPVLVENPVDRTIDAGAMATFSVGAFGTAPFSFHWLKDGVALQETNGISGTTNGVLQVRDFNGSAVGSYSAVVSNAFGVVTSAVALLNVRDLIQFSSTSSTYSETSGTVRIQLERTGPKTSQAEVLFRIAFPSYQGAQSNDLAVTSAQATFVPGSEFATIAIDLVNDMEVEDREAFDIFISGLDPSCCQVGALASTSVFIEDNDKGVEFSSASYLIAENADEVEVTLARAGDVVAYEEDVLIRINDGNATRGEDYSAPENVSVTFPAGTNSVTFSIPILNDSVEDPAEVFHLSIQSWSDWHGERLYATVSIVDNDVGLEFVKSNYTLPERGAPISIELHRMGDPTNSFTVDLIVEGTATGGVDFLPPTNRLTFSPGQTNLSITLAALDDPSVEGTESIVLTVTNASGGAPLGTQTTCWIDVQDNEYAAPDGTFWLAATNVYATEGGTTCRLTVIRGGHSSLPALVDFVCSGSTPAESDLIPTAGTVSFQPLEVTRDIEFTVIDDCVAETNKSFSVNLVALVTGTHLANPKAADVVVFDDDSPGSLDQATLFELDYSATNDNAIALALQGDGKLIIGWRGGILRLNRDGSRDASFISDAMICGDYGCRINCVAVQSDGKIIAGGPGAAIRLRENGARDYGFDFTRVGYRCWSDWEVGWDFGWHCNFYYEEISWLLTLPGGRILVVGDMESGPVRLNSDSSVDLSFLSAIDFDKAALQTDGKLIVTRRNDSAVCAVNRLMTNGALDSTFATFYATGSIAAITVDAQNRCVIAGALTMPEDSFTRPFVRLSSNGLPDTNFASGLRVGQLEMTSGSAVTVRADGQMLVAGHFSDGTTRIAQLMPSGAPDPRFRSDVVFTSSTNAGHINQIIDEPNGDILVAGSFSAANFIDRPGLARLVSERSHIRLTAPAVQQDGSIRVVTGTQPGGRYVLKRSSDLAAWTSLATNIASGCNIVFTDPAPPAGASFYSVEKLE